MKDTSFVFHFNVLISFRAGERTSIKSGMFQKKTINHKKHKLYDY